MTILHFLKSAPRKCCSYVLAMDTYMPRYISIHFQGCFAIHRIINLLEKVSSHSSEWKPKTNLIYLSFFLSWEMFPCTHVACKNGLCRVSPASVRSSSLPVCQPSWPSPRLLLHVLNILDGSHVQSVFGPALPICAKLRTRRASRQSL